VVVNDFLVVSNVVDVGGPVAQASVSALQGSQGLAANPYPGDIVLTAHGLSQGAAPNYPLIAQSNNANTPNADASHGPYVLQAHSTDDMSSALAQAQGGSGGAAAANGTSTAKVVHDPGTGAVTADADATVEGVTIAGVLHIGRVHSHANMVAAPGTPAKRAADTEFGDVSVGGQAVGVTDKGLVLAGTDVPLPPSSTANALLTGAGVTVRYVEQVNTPTSVVASGLAVSAQQNVPRVGLTTVTYWFGQASASASAPAAPDTGSLTAPTGTTSGVGGASSTPASSSAAPPPSLGGSSVAPAPAVGASPVTAGAPVTPQLRLAARTGPSSESLYAVLAGGAIVMVAAAQVFRLLAVRLTWT
jgi:hypothetical protein